MSFLVGQRIRFGARFRDETQRLFDPVAVTASVTMGGASSAFTERTGIRRRSTGDYYLDLVLTSSGPVVVQFSSAGPGQEATQRAIYQVSDDELGAPPIAPPAYAPRQDAPQVLAARARAMMIADIQAAGIECDTSRSDAYLGAVLAEHRRQESERQRRESQDRSRDAWRKT